jgi:hypothetical protein
MRGRIFLVVGILLLGFGVMVSAEGWLIFAERGEWELGIAEKAYALSPSGSFEITDMDDNVTSSAESFVSGEVKADASGEVKTFRGTTELGAKLIINGEGYSDLPAGAEFEYMFGETSVKSDEDFLYESDVFGSGSSTRISGDGTINIKDGVVSSESPFTISNPETGDVAFSSPSGGEVSAELDWKGRPSHIGGGTDANFEKYGFDASSSEGTDVYWDKDCGGNSYLCMEEDKIIFGSNDGGISPTVEMKGENAFFENNEGSDFVQFSGGGGESTNFVVEKDMVTVSGDGKIINGDDELVFDSNGNIFSSKVEGSANTAMPMDAYSSENGVTAKHYVEVTEDGALDVKEVGLLEQGKYGVKRLTDSGTYEMSGDEFITDGVSEALSFDGNFESGEIVEDYRICDSDGCVQLSNVEIDCGTMKRSTLFHKCGTLGVDCELEGDPTQTVKDLYSASQKSGSGVSVTAMTNEGRVYNF